MTLLFYFQTFCQPLDNHTVVEVILNIDYRVDNKSYIKTYHNFKRSSKGGFNLSQSQPLLIKKFTFETDVEKFRFGYFEKGIF